MKLKKAIAVFLVLQFYLHSARARRMAGRRLRLMRLTAGNTISTAITQFTVKPLIPMITTLREL